MSSSTGSPPLDILISGSGIAGPVLAYWLLRANSSHRITLIERDNSLRTAGQSIDIREAAVKIMDRMSLLEPLSGLTTKETGIKFVDDTGRPVGSFPATGDVENQSFTSEFEVFRGDLVQLLFDQVDGRIRTVFGDYVVGYSEDTESGKVLVETKNGKLGREEQRRYDTVLACDGQSSKIRNLALGTTDTPRKHWVPFCNYCSYFTMDEDVLGADRMAIWYNDTRGRVIFVRPDTRPGKCRAMLIRQLLPGQVDENARYRAALKSGSEAIRAVLREDFKGAGWETERIARGMDRSTDFYASETAQIRPPTLIKGRVAFVGDAGFCPTPLTGMGTSLAIIGAYILAGEIGRSTGQEVPAALERYNARMFPYARKVQGIPASTPQWVNPQSGWGVGLQRWIVWGASWVNWSGLPKVAAVVGSLPGAGVLKGKKFELPRYPWDDDNHSA